MSTIQRRTISVHTNSDLSDQIAEFNLNVVYSDFEEEKETILFLHGYLGSVDDFSSLIDQFQENFNVIAVDLRGHGNSEFPIGDDIDWSLHALSQDIETVLKSLVPINVRVNIVASSLSTAIALYLTNNCPAFVKSLFLISPSKEFNLPSWMKLIMNVEKFTPDIISHFFLDIISSIALLTKLNKQEREFVKRGKERILRLQIEAHRRILLETIASWQLELQKITQPVMIVAGVDDKIIPFEKSLELNDELTKSSIFVLKHTKHQILLRRPEIIQILLKEWLTDYDSILKMAMYDEEQIDQF